MSSALPSRGRRELPTSMRGTRAAQEGISRSTRSRDWPETLLSVVARAGRTTTAMSCREREEQMCERKVGTQRCV